MAARGKPKTAAIGLEASLWESADKLRSNMDAAEYKHVVLGLIFLKYISDVFARRKDQLEAAVNDPKSDYFMPSEAAKNAILKSRDEYTSEGVFWVPEGHRWDDLRKAAKQADIGATHHGPALARRTHQLLVLELRTTPTQHRPLQQTTTRPSRPRRRPHPDSETGQMGETLDRLAPPIRARS